MAFSINQQSYKRRRYTLSSEINVTPFVDVMLVLLVIFMVTSPMLIAGVEVDLPKTKEMPLSGRDEPLALTIDKNGNIYIQETMVPLSELKSKLKAIFDAKHDNRVFIRGDKNINYGKVMEVFALLKETGLYNIALVTEIAHN